MNIYPAMRARMGSWDYFIVKMRMEDLVREVDFAHNIHDNKTLDKAIQRGLNETRVKQEIVKYLAFSHDRFFNSIVVAALGGNPKFSAVSIDDDPQFNLIGRDEFNDTFGVLSFDGKQHYYALDGQHRLMSIKTLLEQKEAVPDMPEGFRDEEISVIMLVRRESDDDFMRSYRRIFSNLNRYAKPTDFDTTIIMDEDDTFSILTRRLLIEHKFFWWGGKATNSPIVQTNGKNLRSGESYFTSLQTLYWMNIKLLSTPEREKEGFDSKEYKRFRQSEDVLDKLYIELAMYWDSMIEALPVLSEDATRMREHSLDNRDTTEGQENSLTDHLLFWPIGQEMLAEIVRVLLNRRLPDSSNPSKEEVTECLKELNSVDWELHNPPWRNLLLVEDPTRKGKWKMRSEERRQAVTVSKNILRMMLGIDELSNDIKQELKTDWYALLSPQPEKQQVDEWWNTYVIDRSR